MTTQTVILHGGTTVLVGDKTASSSAALFAIQAKAARDAAFNALAGEVYATLAEAQADTANIPVDAIIQILFDSEYQGSKTYRQWDGTSLIFRGIDLAFAGGDKIHQTISCVIRNPTDLSGWGFINDPTHAPNGFAAVTPLGDGTLKLDHDVTYDKIGAVIAAADETFDATDLSFGTRVAVDHTIIFATQPMSAILNMDTLSTDAHGFLRGTVDLGIGQAASEADVYAEALTGSNVGVVKLNFPNVFNNAQPMSLVTIGAAGASDREMYTVVGRSDVHMNIARMINYGGLLRWARGAGEYQIDSGFAIPPTVSHNNTNGEITITYNGGVGGANPIPTAKVSTLSVAYVGDADGGSAAISVLVKSASNSSLVLKFVQIKTDGTDITYDPILDPTSLNNVQQDNLLRCKFGFDHLTRGTPYGQLVASMGRCRVPLSQVGNDSANVWVIGNFLR